MKIVADLILAVICFTAHSQMIPDHGHFPHSEIVHLAEHIERREE